jgi:hypothetical protein
MRKSAAVLFVTLLVCCVALPAASATVKLKSDLLTLSQLPKGWLASSPSSTAVFGCSASALPASPMAEAGTGFNFGALGAFPLLTEVLASYTNVEAAFNTLTSGLSSCTHVSGTRDGSSFSGTISKMSFGTYGDRSAAYHVSANLQGKSLVADILVVRKGNVLLELEEGNSGNISASGFQSFSKSAVNRL